MDRVNILQWIDGTASRDQKQLHKDIEVAYEGDPAAATRERSLSYPSIEALISRIAYVLYLHKVPIIPRVMSEYAHKERALISTLSTNR